MLDVTARVVDPQVVVFDSIDPVVSTAMLEALELVRGMLTDS